MAEPQNYANHVHRPKLWLATAIAAVLALAASLLLLLRVPFSVNAVALALLSLAAVGLVVLSRRTTTKLQDRIIRLEMQLRLATLGRHQDLERLSMRQVVALRFAGNAELTSLLDRILMENLTPTQIKRAVTDWRADHMRT